MFSFKEYVPCGDIITTNENVLPKQVCSFIYWHCSLFPTFPLEKFLPLYTTANSALHDRVQALSECKHFFQLHSNMFRTVLRTSSGYTTHLHRMFEGVFVPYKLVTKPTRRLFDTTIVPFKTIRSSLISMQLFSQLSCLETLRDCTEVVCVRFSNCKMQHFLYLLKILEENIPECTIANQEIFTCSVSANNNTFCFASSSKRVEELRYYSYCEWLSDKCNAKRFNRVHQLYLKNAFNTSSLCVMSLVLLINKRLSSSRYYYRTVPRPNEPHFQIIASLPIILNEIAAMSSSKPLLFWRGLRAFIEMNGQHIIDQKLYLALRNFFFKNGYAQRLFPQLWDTVSFLERGGQKKRYVMKDVFMLDDQQIPSIAFLYALLLSPLVPKRLKYLIWHHSYTQKVSMNDFPPLTKDRFIDVITLVTGTNSPGTECDCNTSWPLPCSRMSFRTHRSYATDVLQQHVILKTLKQ